MADQTRRPRDRRNWERWAVLTAAAVSQVGGTLWANTARAEEPRRVTEPNLLQEPAEIVSVVDAFDGEDKFDINLSLGLQQTWKSADITRESYLTEDEFSSGGYTASTLNVATYSEATTRLLPRVDAGIYKDLALFLRLPIILSNDRKLEGLDGSEDRQGIALQGFPGETLFQLPFDSPTRSGIEYLAVGVEFGLMNQWRDATKPSWTVGVEGRFNVSEPMHACTETPSAGQVGCADPSDVDRDGVASESRFEGENFSGERDPGVSRGTTGLAFHTYMSKRISYVEPYAGIEGLFEFQTDDSDFGKTDVEGALVNHPPFEGTLVMGVAVMPWEALDEFQRVELDFRFAGTYRSEGRDYSELFDALGSSDATSMREPRYSNYQANTGPDAEDAPSVVDENSSRIYMTGITDVQPHGIYTISTQATWMASEMLKFNLGGGYTFVQGHLITFDQACNPDLKGDLGRAGPCRNVNTGQLTPTGIPNANYREVINTPGRRFRVNSAYAVDLWLGATLMF